MIFQAKYPVSLSAWRFTWILKTYPQSICSLDGSTQLFVTSSSCNSFLSFTHEWYEHIVIFVGCAWFDKCKKLITLYPNNGQELYALSRKTKAARQTAKLESFIPRIRKSFESWWYFYRKIYCHFGWHKTHLLSFWSSACHQSEWKKGTGKSTPLPTHPLPNNITIQLSLRTNLFTFFHF